MKVNKRREHANTYHLGYAARPAPSLCVSVWPEPNCGSLREVLSIRAFDVAVASWGRVWPLNGGDRMAMGLMGKRWPRLKYSAVSGARLAERRPLPSAFRRWILLSLPKSGSLSAVAGCREGPLLGSTGGRWRRSHQQEPENVNNKGGKTADAGQETAESPSTATCPPLLPRFHTAFLTNVAGTIRSHSRHCPDGLSL